MVGRAAATVLAVKTVQRQVGRGRDCQCLDLGLFRCRNTRVPRREKYAIGLRRCIRRHLVDLEIEGLALQ